MPVPFPVPLPTPVPVPIPVPVEALLGIFRQKPVSLPEVEEQREALSFPDRKDDLMDGGGGCR